MTAIPESVTSVTSVTSVLTVPVRQPAKDATGVLRDLHNAGIVPALTGDGLGIAIPAGLLSADLRQRVLACKPELIELLRHAAMPPPAPQPVALPVPVTPPTPETWRQHDKADQAHYWNCAECKAVVVQRQPGAKCPEGQRLSDAYIEAATREGRFIGARVPRQRQTR